MKKRIIRIPISEEYIIKDLKKDYTYLNKLKSKIKPNEIEDGVVLYLGKDKVNWYYIFPNKQILTNYLAEVPISKGKVQLANEIRDFYSIYYTTFETAKKKELIKGVDVKESYLRKVFKDLGNIREKTNFNSKTLIKTDVYIPRVREGKLRDLKTCYSVEDARNTIVDYYIQKYNSLIGSNRCILLKLKNRYYYFLTEDGRVYNEHLRELTVDAEGFVVLSRLRRKVENLLKEFF